MTIALTLFVEAPAVKRSGVAYVVDELITTETAYTQVSYRRSMAVVCLLLQSLRKLHDVFYKPMLDEIFISR